jgi:hypothetical protein
MYILLLTLRNFNTMHDTKNMKFANKAVCKKIDLSVWLFCQVCNVVMGTMVTCVSSQSYYGRYHYQCYHCTYNCYVCKFTYIPTVTTVTNITLVIKVTMFTRLRRCATSQTVPGSIPCGITGDYFRGSFRQNHVSWGRLSLWKWVPGISPGIKVAGVFGWRPTTLVVTKVEKIRGLKLPESLGPPRPVAGYFYNGYLVYKYYHFSFLLWLGERVESEFF